MCQVILSNVERECGQSYVAGVSGDTFIVPEGDVTAIPNRDQDTNIVSTAISLGTGAPSATPPIAPGKWVKWESSDISGKLTVTPEGDADNQIYKCVFEGFVHGVSGARTAALKKSKNHRFVCVIPDNEGNNHLLGEERNGKIFGAHIKVGLQTNDKSGYPVTIEFMAKDLPANYTAAITY